MITRYTEANEDVDIIDQETKHLQELKKRIEERKKAFALNKKPDVITLQQKINEKRDEVLKDLELDKTVVSIEKSPPEAKKKKTDSKPTTEFKVLGVDDFEKKTKVNCLYFLFHYLLSSIYIYLYI